MVIVILGVVEYWYNSEFKWKKLAVSIITIIVMAMKPFSVLATILAHCGLSDKVELSYIVNRMDLYTKTVVALVFIWCCIREKKTEGVNVKMK